jgi:phage terminase small subunit
MAGRVLDQGRKPHSSGLTDLQVRFCREYARSLNAGEAYEKAGYQVTTGTSARANGARLIANANIQAYLREIIDLDEVSVVNAVTAIALTPITEVIKWDGVYLHTKPTSEWSERAKLAVKKIKCKKKTRTNPKGDVETETEVEVEMYDRGSALDKLMRKMRLYPQEGYPDLSKPEALEKEANKIGLTLIGLTDLEGGDDSPAD